MKKLRSTFLFAALGLMTLTACGEKSTKGNWTQEEKDIAAKEINSERASIESMLGESTDAYLDCYLDKVMNSYDNFASADSDLPGCEKLAQECATEIMQ
mgnify:CR=1 FL=1|jgi:hypothetical protein